MDLRTRVVTTFFLILIWGIITACQPTSPETIIKTVIVEKEGDTIVETVVVTVESTEPIIETEDVQSEACCDIFRIGIYEEPLSLNYWTGEFSLDSLCDFE